MGVEDAIVLNYHVGSLVSLKVNGIFSMLCTGFINAGVIEEHLAIPLKYLLAFLIGTFVMLTSLWFFRVAWSTCTR